MHGKALIYAASRHSEKGCICTPLVEILHTLPTKTGHGNLNIRQSFYFLYPVHCSYLLAQWYPALVSLPLNELFLLMHTPKTRSFSQRTDLPDSRLPIQCSQVAQHLRFSRTLIHITPFINDALNFHAGCGNQRSGNKHDLLTLLTRSHCPYKSCCRETRDNLLHFFANIIEKSILLL